MAGLVGNVPLNLPDFQSIEEFITSIKDALQEDELYADDIPAAIMRSVAWIERSFSFRYMRRQRLLPVSNTLASAAVITVTAGVQAERSTRTVVSLANFSTFAVGDTIGVQQVDNTVFTLVIDTIVVLANLTHLIHTAYPHPAGCNIGAPITKGALRSEVIIPAKAKEVPLMELFDPDGVTFIGNLEERELIEISTELKLSPPTTPSFYCFQTTTTFTREELYPPTSTTAVLPTHSTIYSLIPNVDKDYKVRVTSFEKTVSFPRSGEDTNFNWLLDEAPDVLFARVMTEMSPIVRDPDLRALYDPVAKEGLQGLIGEEIDFRRAGTSSLMTYEGH